MNELKEFDSAVAALSVACDGKGRSIAFHRYGSKFASFVDAESKLTIKGQLPYTGTISVDDLQVAFGRKWLYTAKRLVALGRVFEQYLADKHNDLYVEVSICTTDGNVKKILGVKDRQLSNIIKQACRVNLLKCTTCDFGVQQQGRYYIFHDAIYQQLIQILDIDAIPAKAEEDDKTIITTDKKIKIGYGQHLPASITDGEVIAAIHNQYPLLKEYQAKVAMLNERMDNKWLAMAFEPTITRGKKGCVSKTGIRCTSPICQTKSDEREEILKRDMGWKRVYHYDVKSSIYRVAYWLYTGIWADDEIDFYAVMRPAASTLTRGQFKSLCMRDYFAKSNRLFCQWLKGAIRRVGIDVPASLADGCNIYYQAMREVIGESVGSEIFLYESMLYIDLLDALTQLGYKVAQVYDCFYSDIDISMACKKLLPALAERLFERLGKTRHDGVDLAALMARENTADIDAAMDAIDVVMEKTTAKANEQEQEEKTIQEEKTMENEITNNGITENGMTDGMTEDEFVDAVMAAATMVSTPDSRAAWEKTEEQRKRDDAAYRDYIAKMSGYGVDACISDNSHDESQEQTTTDKQETTDKATTYNGNESQEQATVDAEDVGSMVASVMESTSKDNNNADDDDKWAWLDVYGIA